MIEPIRQIYWNINQPGEGFLAHIGEIYLYTLVLVTIAIATWGVLRDIERWRRGKPAARIANLPARLWESLMQVFGQTRVLQERRPGTMHALIFFGFLTLFIGTDVIAVEEDFTVPFMGPDAGTILVGNFYQSYEFILDLLGLVFLIGLVWAWVRRYNVRVERLDSRRTDLWVLGSLLFIVLGGYLVEGLRLANQMIGNVEVYNQTWARNSFIGYGLATLFRAIGLGQGSGVGLALHQVLWYTHAGMTAAFLGSLPFSKYKHIIYTPLNTFFQDEQPKGALQPIPALEAEIEKDEPRLGIMQLAEFTWKQRLDFDACMRCGRCQAACPATASGSDLSPKYLITKMHDLMKGAPILLRDGSTVTVAHTANGEHDFAEGAAGEHQNPRTSSGVAQILLKGDAETLPLIEAGLFTENELWACTTCRACMSACPAMIEHVDAIVDLRRNLTMIQSEVPQGVKRVLEGIERAGNPWRLPTKDRTAWTEGLDVPILAEKGEVDVLYWVGCAPSYDDRSKRVARAMVQLLQLAGVDFAILGDEETCTGDPARRMGEELLYQTQAQTNIEAMQQYKFKTVITTCAHCFNTIKNEYPQFGGKAGVDYEVIHHTTYLAQLVRNGKLKPTQRVSERVAYHDPCYIGRYNDIYDDPRALLQAIPGLELAEPPETSRERAMCCGGGGGNVWLESWGDKNVNMIRLQQIQKAEPQTLAVACPFCMVMFDDAAKNAGVGESLARKDVAELLLQAITPESA